VLDNDVRLVLERLELEDADERARGLPSSERSRQVSRTTGVFLFGLVASHREPQVLELGGSRGYSSIWLAAAARIGGGRLISSELDPRKIEAWRKNVADAGLDDVAELRAGDAFDALAELEGPFDLCFIDAEKDDYERLFAAARPKLRDGSVVVADNVLSHEDTLGAYSKARQEDPTLESVTIPLDRGLELSVVLDASV
jgi:predicted O-methyltransferase YrrM